MKKVGYILLLISITTTAFSIDFSLGGITSIGFPIMRGNETHDEIYTSSIESLFGLSTDIMTLTEFTPFFALEAGIGYKSMNIGYAGKPLLGRHELSLPLLLRIQTKYNLNSDKIQGGVTYLSAGVRLGFSLFWITGYEWGATHEWDEENLIGDIKTVEEPVIDIALALGQEFQIEEKHYLGIRISYDINISNVYQTSANATEPHTFPDNYEGFIDYIGLGISYRCTF